MFLLEVITFPPHVTIGRDIATQPAAIGSYHLLRSGVSDSTATRTKRLASCKNASGIASAARESSAPTTGTTVFCRGKTVAAGTLPFFPV